MDMNDNNVNSKDHIQIPLNKSYDFRQPSNNLKSKIGMKLDINNFPDMDDHVSNDGESGGGGNH